MSVIEVFNEFTRNPGVSERKSRIFLKYFDKYVHQPYSWNDTEKLLVILNKTENRIQSPRMYCWLYGIVALLTILPTAILQAKAFESKLIRILLTLLFIAFSFCAYFQNKTCSDFCHFVNEVLKFINDASKSSKSIKGGNKSYFVNAIKY